MKTKNAILLLGLCFVWTARADAVEISWNFAYQPIITPGYDGTENINYRCTQGQPEGQDWTLTSRVTNEYNNASQEPNITHEHVEQVGCKIMFQGLRNVGDLKTHGPLFYANLTGFPASQARYMILKATLNWPEAARYQSVNYDTARYWGLTAENTAGNPSDGLTMEVYLGYPWNCPTKALPYDWSQANRETRFVFDMTQNKNMDFPGMTARSFAYDPPWVEPRVYDTRYTVQWTDTMDFATFRFAPSSLLDQSTDSTGAVIDLTGIEHIITFLGFSDNPDAFVEVNQVEGAWALFE